jgi:hypothetical protein
MYTGLKLWTSFARIEIADEVVRRRTIRALPKETFSGLGRQRSLRDALFGSQR